MDGLDVGWNFGTDGLGRTAAPLSSREFHVYFVTLPSRVILATTRLSAAAAIKTAKGEASILEDQSLAGPLGLLAGEASKLVVVHGGRAFAVMQPLLGMQPAEAANIAPLLDRATLSLSTRESPTSLDINAVVSAPGLGPVIQRLISEGGKSSRRAKNPERRQSQKKSAQPSVPAAGK